MNQCAGFIVDFRIECCKTKNRRVQENEELAVDGMDTHAVCKTLRGYKPQGGGLRESRSNTINPWLELAKKGHILQGRDGPLWSTICRRKWPSRMRGEYTVID